MATDRIPQRIRYRKPVSSYFRLDHPFGQYRAAIAAARERAAKTKVSLHHDESGMTSMASIFMIFILILLVGFVANVGYEVKEKIELQNAADSVAYSTCLWKARCMNAVTASNHMVGELTALCALHESLGGPELDVYYDKKGGKRGFPFTSEHTTLNGIIQGLENFAFAKTQTHKMYSFLESTDNKLKKQLSEKMMRNNESLILKGLDKQRLYAGATIYDCKIALKKFYAIMLGIKVAGNALFMIPSSTVVAIGPVVIPVGLIAGVAGFLIHAAVTVALIKVAFEWLILDMLIRIAHITSPVKIRVVENLLIPSLCEYNYGLMSGKTSLKKVQAIRDRKKYDPPVHGAIAMTLKQIKKELKVEVNVFPKIEDTTLPLRLEPGIRKTGRSVSWGPRKAAEPDADAVEAVQNEADDATNELDEANEKLDKRRDELSQWILDDQGDIDDLEQKVQEAPQKIEQLEQEIAQQPQREQAQENRIQQQKDRIERLKQDRLDEIEAQKQRIKDLEDEEPDENFDDDEREQWQQDQARKKRELEEDHRKTLERMQRDIDNAEKELPRLEKQLTDIKEDGKKKEKELKELKEELKRLIQELEDKKGTRNSRPPEKPHGQRDKVELFLKTFNRQITNDDRAGLTPEQIEALDKSDPSAGSDPSFQKFRPVEDVEKELASARRDLGRIERTLRSRYMDEKDFEDGTKRKNRNRKSLEELRDKLRKLVSDKEKELEEAKNNPVNKLLDDAKNVVPGNPSYNNINGNDFRFDLNTEKYSQWCRATYPYLDAGRAKLTYTLGNVIPVPPFGGIGLDMCNFDEHYEKWTNRYVITKVNQLRDSREWKRQGSRGGLRFPLKTGTKRKQHLLVMMDHGFDSDPTTRKHLKGFEKWAGNDDQAKDSAEDTFTNIGIAFRQPHKTFLFSSFFHNPKEFFGTAAVAQCILYNGNEQSPSLSLGATQAKIGWDTLNWAPDSGAKEHPPGNPANWSGRSEADNGPKLWELFKPGFLAEPYSKVQQNWQAKLMQLTRRRVGQAKSEIYENAPLDLPPLLLRASNPVYEEFLKH